MTMPMAASAQVTIGYGNPVLVTAASVIEQRRGQRETVQFGVAGVNVRPVDGSLIYDEDTIWRVDQADRPFSLTITENDPLLELRRIDILNRTAAVSRRERVYVQISGPAANALRSVFVGDLTTLLQPTLPTINLSVFTP